MSLMERIFGTRQPQQSTPPVAPVSVTNNPAQNQPIQTHQSSGTAPNGTIPAGATTPEEKKEEPKFNGDFWKAPEADPKAQEINQPVDPQKILEAASKVDFTKFVTQEDLAKMAAGGPEAVAHMMQVMNKGLQQSYGQSAYATTKIVEQAVAQAKEEFAAKVPTMVQAKSSRDLLAQNTKAFSDPAVAPIMDMVHKQLVEKYPTASAQEISVLAQDYMKQMANVINPTSAADTSKNPAKDLVDWDEYVKQ